MFEQLHPSHDPLPLNPIPDLASPAISTADWDLLQTWMRALDKQEMFYCQRCKELWFDLTITNRVCQRCDTRDRGYDLPFLMSYENNMDPGPAPDLPELIDIEQMMIALVHISMHIAHIKGAQYRYKGHVMTFLRDVPDVVTVLPRLPQHCNMILIRPKQVLIDGQLPAVGSTRQFRRSFTVRRWAVQVRFPSQADSPSRDRNPAPSAYHLEGAG
jgi:ATP-dependent DNA helicase PIF1